MKKVFSESIWFTISLYLISTSLKDDLVSGLNILKWDTLFVILLGIIKVSVSYNHWHSNICCYMKITTKIMSKHLAL